MTAKKAPAPEAPAPEAPASDEEELSLSFTPATVAVETRKSKKPNPFQEAVNSLDVAKEGDRPTGLEVTVSAKLKDGSVNGLLDRAQDKRNEENPDAKVTVRRKILKTNDDGSRLYLIWVINKVVRKKDTETETEKNAA